MLPCKHLNRFKRNDKKIIKKKAFTRKYSNRTGASTKTTAIYLRIVLLIYHLKPVRIQIICNLKCYLTRNNPF